MKKVPKDEKPIPICPIHGKELKCPSCLAAERGRKGGQNTSEEKTETARKNVQKAQKQRWSKK